MIPPIKSKANPAVTLMVKDFVFIFNPANVEITTEATIMVKNVFINPIHESSHHNPVIPKEANIDVPIVTSESIFLNFSSSARVNKYDEAAINNP